MDSHTLDCLDFPRIREMLAGYAATGLGRALSAIVRPAARPELVRRWLDQFRELERLVEARGTPPLSGVFDVREVVRRCAPPLRVTVEEVALLGSTLRGTHAIGSWLAGLPEDYPEIRHLAQRIGDFGSIAARIAAVIDERGQVRDDASPKLAGIRRRIAETAERTREAVEKLLHDPAVRRVLQFANYTFHGDRLVLPVRMEYRGRVPGIIHRSSDSGATIYVEPGIAVELNNLISSLRGEEAEEINRLLWELAHEVHVNHEAILRTLDAVAVLDLVYAKLRFAADYGLRCPEVVDGPELNVRGARHPLLLELARRRSEAASTRGDGAAAAGDVVAIDFRLGDDFNMLLITGPNTGGKTVTLKTVGLLTLMVQAGLPVPVAEGSRFGLFRSVLIDIGDEQSLAQSLSTFSAHLKRQMEMLEKAGPRTLVLIDELGAGTDPDEGAAIGRAILDDLLERDCRCIATTHLGALKSYSLERPGVENGSVEFDEETLRPTYQLRIGEPGMSHAIAIAQRLGMPRRLVAAARRNLSGQARAFQAAMRGTSAAKRQAEAARAAADTARLEAARAQSDAEAERSRLEKQKSAFHEWAQRVAHLQPGDAVRVRGFDRDGRIVRVRIDLHRAEVDVGSFHVEVPLGDVLPPETPAPPARPPRPTDVIPEGPVVKYRPGGERSAARGGRSAGQPPSKGGERPRRAGKPRDSAEPGDAGRAGDGAGRPRGRRGEGEPRETLPRIPPMDETALAALQPGDEVFALSFRRPGVVVRLAPGKRLAIVRLGVLEVEIPFQGLGAAARQPG